MNILIISSNYTGAGHRSIAEALIEQFDKHTDVKVNVMEGFDFNGKVFSKVGKTYGFITRRAKIVWKLVWNLSVKKPVYIYKLTEFTMGKNFLKFIEDEKPDVILSIHPNFNSAVLNILSKNKIDIPFITLVADLVSISALWADSRAACVICPTEEAKVKCIEYGVEEAKIKIFKFPVRSEFFKFISNKEYMQESLQVNNSPMEFLIMSGGEGVGDLGSIAEILLNKFNCNIKIISGRNVVLKKNLESNLLIKYMGRVKVYGFVNNVQDIMADSHLIITRGSPNVMMEAVACNVPIVVTGVLLGQEEENADYIERYKLGVACEDISDLQEVIQQLIFHDGKKLKEIKEAQKIYMEPYSSKHIADFIISTIS